MLRNAKGAFEDGRRGALQEQFDHLADLIERDAELDLIDMVADRVQGKQRPVEGPGEELVSVEDLFRRWRRLDAGEEAGS